MDLIKNSKIFIPLIFENLWEYSFLWQTDTLNFGAQTFLQVPFDLQYKIPVFPSV
jgi:hypothetical protein